MAAQTALSRLCYVAVASSISGGIGSEIFNEGRPLHIAFSVARCCDKETQVH